MDDADRAGVSKSSTESVLRVMFAANFRGAMPPAEAYSWGARMLKLGEEFKRLNDQESADKKPRAE